jgi:signal transduction histidine kinase
MPDSVTPRPFRSRRLALAIALASGVAALALAVAEMSFSSAAASLGSLGERAQTRTAIQTLMRRLLDAESAQRGYLLTGRREYLEPFRDAQADISQALDLLARRNPGDAAWKAQVSVLSQRTLEKLSEVTETMSLFDAGQEEAWRNLMLTDIGREKMEAARTAAETLLAAENRSVAQARQDIEDTLQRGRIGMRLMTGLSLLALIFYFRNGAALERVQREHARALAAERDLLETEVRQRTAELTELARHLQTAREDERAHLARELHDELGALLTASKFDLARLKRSLGTTPAPEQMDRLQHLNSSIDQGIALKRRIIEDLRPSALSNLGLKVALDILAREFAARSGLAVDAQIADVASPPDVQIVVYRIVQESLTNIAKHAMASRVTLRLQAEGGELQLDVGDDGRGLAPGAATQGTHGLVGMRFRVESVGGRMRISSPPGQGTQIAVRLPMPVLSSG